MNFWGAYEQTRRIKVQQYKMIFGSKYIPIIDQNIVIILQFSPDFIGNVKSSVHSVVKNERKEENHEKL